MRRAVTVRMVGPLQWIVYPALVALAVTVIVATPLRLFGLQLPEPVFPMVLAFAWPLIRPSILAPVVLAACGLALDLVWYTPLGLWPPCLLAVYGVVLAARPLLAGQDTAMLFGCYMGGCLLAFGLAYAIVGGMAGIAPNLVSTALQFIPTLLLFPFANALIERFDDGDVRFR